MWQDGWRPLMWNTTRLLAMKLAFRYASFLARAPSATLKFRSIRPNF